MGGATVPPEQRWLLMRIAGEELRGRGDIFLGPTVGFSIDRGLEGLLMKSRMLVARRLLERDRSVCIVR